GGYVRGGQLPVNRDGEHLLDEHEDAVSMDRRPLRNILHQVSYLPPGYVLCDAAAEHGENVNPKMPLVGLPAPLPSRTGVALHVFAGERVEGEGFPVRAALGGRIMPLLNLRELLFR